MCSMRFSGESCPALYSSIAMGCRFPVNTARSLSSIGLKTRSVGRTSSGPGAACEKDRKEEKARSIRTKIPTAFFCMYAPRVRWWCERSRPGPENSYQGRFWEGRDLVVPLGPSKPPTLQLLRFAFGHRNQFFGGFLADRRE